MIVRIAERTDFSNVDKGFWSKITDLFNGMLEKLGFKTKITEDGLKQILKASYANLMKTAEERTGEGEGEAAERNEDGTRFSRKEKDKKIPPSQETRANLVLMPPRAVSFGTLTVALQTHRESPPTLQRYQKILKVQKK